jgi:hypothetical protein
LLLCKHKTKVRKSVNETLVEGRKETDRATKEDGLKVVMLNVVRKVKVLEVASTY